MNTLYDLLFRPAVRFSSYQYAYNSMPSMEMRKHWTRLLKDTRMTQVRVVKGSIRAQKPLGDIFGRIASL